MGKAPAIKRCPAILMNRVKYQSLLKVLMERTTKIFFWCDGNKHEPAGYKAPSYDKAQTVLLDECVRDMEKGLTRGAMFMYADDFFGVEKTGAAIANLFLGAIETIGPIFINHTHALDIFRDNSQLELLKVAKTIFASHYIFLKRLWDCRESLATIIVLNSWRELLKNVDEKLGKMDYYEGSKTGEIYEKVAKFSVFIILIDPKMPKWLLIHIRMLLRFSMINHFME
uniref:Uncharacterized protein n=1 Tax=Lactuca sativa TaxID=4236 RepID=A0A9R1VL76_LACSA|nr:hypothetical protein LSAT_V11C500252830 [Lactuca sativa]